jgi:hypothetical protein
MKLMTDIQYKYLLVSYSKAFKEGEPYPIEVEQPTRLKDMINYHLGRLGYTVADLAKLLHLTSEETQKAYIRPPKGGLRLVVSN